MTCPRAAPRTGCGSRSERSLAGLGRRAVIPLSRHTLSALSADRHVLGHGRDGSARARSWSRRLATNMEPTTAAPTTTGAAMKIIFRVSIGAQAGRGRRVAATRAPAKTCVVPGIGFEPTLGITRTRPSTRCLPLIPRGFPRTCSSTASLASTASTICAALAHQGVHALAPPRGARDRGATAASPCSACAARRSPP